MILTPTKPITSSPYLSNGTAVIDGSEREVFIAHRETSCEFCEAPLGSSRRHPVIADNFVEVCGDFIVRLVD